MPRTPPTSLAQSKGAILRSIGRGKGTDRFGKSGFRQEAQKPENPAGRSELSSYNTSTIPRLSTRIIPNQLNLHSYKFPNLS
jgi:hypothetical protein